MSQQLLATIENPRAALAFVDYMALQSIDIALKPTGPQRLELWVDEQYFATASAQFAEFSHNPNDQKYANASWQTGTTHHGLKYQSDGPSPIATFLKQGGWVTQLLIAVCVLLYVFRSNELYQSLYFPINIEYAVSEFWRCFTPALIHFSTLHIIFNVMWWWALAGQLEKNFSSSFLLLFTLFTAIISNFAQFIVSQSPYFGGLSGVVFALMGFCWLYGKMQPQQSIQLNDALFGFCLVWLVLGYADLLWVNIANTAHLSGLLAGLAFAAVQARRS